LTGPILKNVCWREERLLAGFLRVAGDPAQNERNVVKSERKWNDVDKSPGDKTSLTSGLAHILLRISFKFHARVT
jgi:hypothetical protein